MSAAISCVVLPGFRASFDLAKERFPDAPGLPRDVYFFSYPAEQRFPENYTTLRFGSPDAGSAGMMIPWQAAEALCVTRSIELGAWWQQQAPGRFFDVSYDGDGLWTWSISESRVKSKCGGAVSFVLAAMAAMDSLVNHFGVSNASE